MNDVKNAKKGAREAGWITQRKGFIFAITFALLFMLLAAITANFLEHRELARFGLSKVKATEREAFIQNDLAADISSILRVTTAVTVNASAGTTTLTITDSIPSNYSTPSMKYEEWENYTTQVYAAKVNTNISVNSSNFTSTPKFVLQPFSLSHEFISFSRHDVVTYGSSAVRNYTLTAVLNKEPVAVNTSAWSWSGGATNLYLKFNITGPGGTPVDIGGATEGYVSPTSTNYFWVNVSTGKFHVNTGDYSSYGNYSLRTYVENVSAATTTVVILNSVAEPVSVVAPVLITAGNSTTYAVLSRG